MSQILSFQRSASSRVDPGYLGHTQTGETQASSRICIQLYKSNQRSKHYNRIKNDSVGIRA